MLFRSVIPLSIASTIIDETCIETCVKIHTVAESKKLKVFTADKLEIIRGEDKKIHTGVKIAITPLSDRAILHPDFLEE